MQHKGWGWLDWALVETGWIRSSSKKYEMGFERVGPIKPNPTQPYLFILFFKNFLYKGILLNFIT